MRDEIGRAFPGDSILGEEEGLSGSTGRRTWLIDPIDGTKNFVDGVQLWATIVGLLVEDEPVVGVVHVPGLGEHYESARGGGASLNGRPIRVSTVDRVEDSLILHSGLEDWLDTPYWPGFEQLVRSVRRTRDYCDFWGHMLVARGSAQAMLEVDPGWPWDWAAPALIVREAGGTMSTFDGQAPAGACRVLSTNGVLHAEVLERLRTTRGA